MSTEILMPALSPTMEEGKLARWLVKEGDTVKSGDILAEIETDKATMEFEAVDEGRIGKILVPVEEVVEMKSGQKAISERKFFPGYVLVEMEMTDDTWHLVKSTPKVTGFVGGTANRPTPITQKEVDAILRQVQEGVEKPRPKVLFELGEAVRVKEGPFTDFHGNVEDVNYEKSKLRVSVTIFGRSTPVELDFSQVEKA